MINGIIFDMDGLMFDTEKVYAIADFKAAEEMGFTLTQDVINSQIGTNPAEVKATFTKALGPTFNYDIFHKKVSEHSHAYFNKKGVPKKAGLDQLLAWLKDNNFKMAVASSSPIDRIQWYLEKTGVTHYFNCLISGDMIKKSKPEPDIFLAAAKELGLPPKHCLALEDSHNGVRSASSAGCVTLMVPDLIPVTAELEGLCAKVLNSLNEVTDFIKQHNSNI